MCFFLLNMDHIYSVVSNVAIVGFIAYCSCQVNPTRQTAFSRTNADALPIDALDENREMSHRWLF